jgi:hypothetical protein
MNVFSAVNSDIRSTKRFEFSMRYTHNKEGERVQFSLAQNYPVGLHLLVEMRAERELKIDNLLVPHAVQPTQAQGSQHRHRAANTGAGQPTQTQADSTDAGRQHRRRQTAQAQHRRRQNQYRRRERSAAALKWA